MTLRDKIYNYKTENEMGFNPAELKELLSEFKGINMDKYNSAMRGNTCIANDRGELVIYHCDVLTALRCGIENRNMNLFEMD